MNNLTHLFNNKGFNPSQVDRVNTDFSTIPEGTYRAEITKTELADNKNNTGVNLTLKVTIETGLFANRILFDNLCVVHENKHAQSIAQTKLAQICEAIGITDLKDTSQICDKSLSIKVKVELDEYATDKLNTGEKVMRTSITGYYPLSSNSEPELSNSEPKDKTDRQLAPKKQVTPKHKETVNNYSKLMKDMEEVESFNDDIDF